MFCLFYRKKPVKSYKVSNSSSENTGTLPTPVPSNQQQTSADTTQKMLLSNNIPVQQIKLKNSPPLIYSTSAPSCSCLPSNQLNTHNSLQHGGTTDATLVQNNFQPSTMTIQEKPDTFLDVDIKNETLYNDRGNSISTSNCNLKLSGNILSSPAQVLSNMPLLYVNNVNQAPVCPVVPSIKLQKMTPQVPREVQYNINSLYTPRQQKYPWLPIVTETMHEQNDVPSPLTTLDNLKEYQNKTGCIPNTGLETNHTVCSSTHDNVYNPDCFPGNLPYIQQHHPLLPNLRFPLHSTPKSNFTGTTAAVTRKPDLLSIINQQMREQQFQPMARDIIQGASNTNLFSNSRTLSAFPYTHEFVFPNGKTQNVYLNRSGVPMEQNVHQNICASQNNNAVLNSINRNQPIHGKNILSTHTGLPMHNISSQMCNQLSTAIFNPKSVQIVPTQSHTIPSQPQNNLRAYFTPTQNGSTLSGTPLDMSTPIQYNQEVNRALSNQNSENTSSLSRTKPKKLSMSANSAVRKKLKLTPNN